MTQAILITLVVVEGLMIGCLWWHKGYLSSTLRLCLEVMDEDKREEFKRRSDKEIERETYPEAFDKDGERRCMKENGEWEDTVPF